jgi:anti-anti-sigma factor
MSARDDERAPAPQLRGDAGASALVAALEVAPAAVYLLAGRECRPVWANTRARALGTGRDELPVVAGRPLPELVDTVLRTGAAETVSGPLGARGPAATVMVRPVPVEGDPGVLVVLETDDGSGVFAPLPMVSAEVVEQVQHSLLPPSLPLLPDLALSGSYHQASSPRSAGGDWYDAVPLGRGRLALVVGDAVGSGVPAAGAMSRLRGALRSTTLRDPAPAAVLAALDRFAAQMEDVEGASVFYGLLDIGTGRLSYAVAGHPAPLVVRADGSTSVLPVRPRPPLGSLPGAETAVEEQLLEEGATLVLFSDGAIAGAPAGPGHALGRLAEVARDAVGAPGALDVDAVPDLAGAIAGRVHDSGSRPDDVAVLVAHRRATVLQPLVLDQPAVPASLPAVRRRLSAWLTGLGMGEQDRVGVMVAVGEACANAAEHAYRGAAPGPMHVRASVDVDGVLTVTVRDEGTWRPPDRDPGDRGRGLLIMRQLVDGVVLEEQGGTTVTLSVRLRRTADTDADPAVAEGGATVEVDRSGPRVVVRVSGAVDQISAEQVRIRLLEASHGGTVPADLDLTEVVLFSSSAVRVVLAVARIARDEGWRLGVRAEEGGVTRHILEISGLAGLVDLR